MPIRVFVFEYVTGGSWNHPPPQPESLVREGAAMLAALTEDFARVPFVAVDAIWDERSGPPPHSGPSRQPGGSPVRWHLVEGPSEAEAAFEHLAGACDWTVAIAPEFSDTLGEICRRVEQRGRLLGPSSIAVEWASDKHVCCEDLQTAGVRVPRGVALAPGDELPADFAFPAVLKPRDGAGSLGIHYCSARSAEMRASAASRLEAWIPGLPASVAVLSGPHGALTLPACRQRLSDDGRLTYLGGSCPLPADLDRRARQLAEQVQRAAPPMFGYWGLDLVLSPGPEDSPADDTAIEVNPRLTTSYIGLRKLARSNLAEAMLRWAEGEDVELSWHDQVVEFDAAGKARSESRDPPGRS